MGKVIGIFMCVMVLTSCEYFKQETQRTPIARVNDNYLYEEDIQQLVSESTSKEDSTLIVSNYINRWARQQLLLNKAAINLPQDQLDTYNKLVQEYKNELYTEAYKNAIVTKQLDSTVSETEYEDFYALNKENFKLNDELLKVRYIHVAENYSNLSSTRQKLDRFNKKDKQDLNEISIQFKKFNFNDSMWVKKKSLVEEIPALSAQNEQLLKKSNFTQLQDSLGVYLVKIQDVLTTNDIAPLSYVRPTIKQIILNKRKLELIKNLEKDIINDAIKNKNFEIYQEQ
ncbi:peptidyl-prolyl cis-trans isomerase [Altibacter sp.]|uniref:peptidyl-prolyl cis-trans isomerase n=1 Tax=Altibacter sp. TaxID=2024823 RepID=UPI0025BE676E|nr:peptidyl-prolyl cis-trans isomerase [Altibacter sp.]